MPDLGLNVDLATSAVREEDGKKKKNKAKKAQRAPKGTSAESSPGRDEAAFSKSPGPKGQRVAGLERSDGYWEKDLFLLHEELTDSEEEDDSSDEDLDTYRQLYGGSGGSSRKRLGAPNRYQVMTGNVQPTDLSIAKHFSDEDILKLTSDENFGVAIQPVGFWQVGKKNRKAKRGIGLVDVAIVKYEFNGVSATSAIVEEDFEDDDDGSTQTSAIIYGTKKKTDHSKTNKWPPHPLRENPPPPTEKPPRVRGSTNFLTRPKSLPGPPLPPPPPKKAEFELMAPPPLKKQSSLVSTSMVSAGGVIKKNMKKLAKFRGPSTTASPPAQQISAAKIEERFLVAKRVNWIVPPPPRPRLPPPDGTNQQQLQLDFEILRMFCEDLRSMAVKLEEKQDRKQSQIASLQEEIQQMDDEIAGLVQPKGLVHTAKSKEAITSQLKSVTSGNIFRVEKY